MALPKELPERPETEFFEWRVPDGAALGYAQECVDEGIVVGVSAEELVPWLERAAAYYYQGSEMRAHLEDQVDLREQLLKKDDEGRPPSEGKRRAAAVLAVPPKHRLRDYGDDALIQIMAQIADGCAIHVGTADWRDGVDRGSPFQRFVFGWLRCIDPGRSDIPSRMKFRTAIKRFHQNRPA